jgi:hypothetical protein
MYEHLTLQAVELEFERQRIDYANDAKKTYIVQISFHKPQRRYARCGFAFIDGAVFGAAMLRGWRRRGRRSKRGGGRDV